MPCCGIFSAGSGSGGLACGWEVDRFPSNPVTAPGDLDQQVGRFAAVPFDEIESDGKDFQLLLLGQAPGRTVQTDQAGMQRNTRIFAGRAARRVRSAKIACIHRHEAPIVAKDDRPELTIRPPEKAKVPDVTGLVTLLLREPRQIDAQAFVDQELCTAHGGTVMRRSIPAIQVGV